MREFFQYFMKKCGEKIPEMEKWGQKWWSGFSFCFIFHIPLPIFQKFIHSLGGSGYSAKYTTLTFVNTIFLVCTFRKTDSAVLKLFEVSRCQAQASYRPAWRVHTPFLYIKLYTSRGLMAILAYINQTSRYRGSSLQFWSSYDR